MLVIREYNQDDALFCGKIINACIEVMEGFNHPAKEFAREKNELEPLHAALSGCHSLVAELDGRPVGVGAITENEIRTLYVDPARHGRGVGKKLMKQLEDIARGQGVTNLFVRSSPTAEAFYSYCGYQTIRQECYTRGDALFFCVRMEKSLL